MLPDNLLYYQRNKYNFCYFAEFYCKWICDSVTKVRVTHKGLLPSPRRLQRFANGIESNVEIIFYC